MISEDSLLTILPVFLSHSTGTVNRVPAGAFTLSYRSRTNLAPFTSSGVHPREGPPGKAPTPAGLLSTSPSLPANAHPACASLGSSGRVFCHVG